MKEKKSKVEVIFKTFFNIPDPTKEGIKSFLEEAIEGLKVKSADVVPGKNNMKALVTSNLGSLLVDQEALDESTSPSEGSRDSPMLRLGMPSRKQQVALEEKDREITDLQLQLGKLRKDLSEAMNREAELVIQVETFQEQLGGTSSRIEAVEHERSRLEEENNLLKDEVDRLMTRLENRSLANITEDSTEADLGMQVKALEDLLEQRTRELNEDKKALQGQLGLMSLKILTEKDRADMFINKAEMYDSLEQSVAPMEAENKNLKEELVMRAGEMAVLEKVFKEGVEELERLRKEGSDYLKKIGKLESLIRKSETKAANAIEKLKKEEQSKEGMKGQLEELRRKVAELEAAKAEWLAKPPSGRKQNTAAFPMTSSLEEASRKSPVRASEPKEDKAASRKGKAPPKKDEASPKEDEMGPKEDEAAPKDDEADKPKEDEKTEPKNDEADKPKEDEKDKPKEDEPEEEEPREDEDINIGPREMIEEFQEELREGLQDELGIPLEMDDVKEIVSEVVKNKDLFEAIGQVAELEDLGIGDEGEDVNDDDNNQEDPNPEEDPQEDPKPEDDPQNDPQDDPQNDPQNDPQEDPQEDPKPEDDPQDDPKKEDDNEDPKKEDDDDQKTKKQEEDDDNNKKKDNDDDNNNKNKKKVQKKEQKKPKKSIKKEVKKKSRAQDKKHKAEEQDEDKKSQGSNEKEKSDTHSDKGETDPQETDNEVLAMLQKALQVAKSESSNIEKELAKAKTDLEMQKKQFEATKADYEKKLAEERGKKGAGESREERKTKDKSPQTLQEELSATSKLLGELQDRNKQLQTRLDNYASYPEVIESLQKQHELMVRENADLKASLFEAELRKAGSEAAEKKVNVIEDVKKCLTDVVYVYKTMSTNAKQFEGMFVEKRERAEAFVQAIDDLGKIKKANDVAAAIKSLEEDIPFLKGFPPKSDQLKTMVSCLKRAAEKKQGKFEFYDDEIKKYNSMVQLAEVKVAEYEEKLNYYF